MPATPYTITEANNEDFVTAGTAIPQAWSDISLHYNIPVRILKELIALINGTDAADPDIEDMTDLEDYTGIGIVDRLFALEQTNNLGYNADIEIGRQVSDAGNRSIKFWLGSATSNFAQLLYNQASSYFKFQNQAGTAVRVKGATATESDDLMTKAQVDAAFAALTIFVPGNIMPVASSAADPKWTFCDGKALSRTTYSELFTKIGTTYGAGNGTTTFNVPDLRGQTIAGLDNMGGTSANRVTNSQADTLGGLLGAESVALAAANNGTHSHTYTRPSQTQSTSQVTSSTLWFRDTTISDNTGASGSGTAHNNMQPTRFMNYQIYTGV